MTKGLKNLSSEQIPNDGGWHWHRLVAETNNRLGEIGKHGKRAKIKVTPKPGKPISAQFSLNGKQQNFGLNLSLSKNNLIKAEEICTLITSQLVADTFTLEWFYSLIGKTKKVSKPEKLLTCGEMLEQYKAYYFKQTKNNKTPKSTWRVVYGHLEKTLLLHKNDPINLKIINEVINYSDNDTPVRAHTLNGLARFLKYFNNEEFKPIIKRYKSENNPKPQKKYIPTDTEIILVHIKGFTPKNNCPKKWLYRYPQWQFLYALLATYGLRIHEAWNIKNWDKPVYLKKGDYIAVPDDENKLDEEDEGEYSYRIVQEDEIIYPVLDAVNNKHHILCIGHNTKTGYREAFPISPSGIGEHCNWIEKFNLLQTMNLPDIENPLHLKGTNGDCGFSCSSITAKWFTRHKYGFTAHALRHAYNIRGHNLGVNQKILSNSLGHGLRTNSTTYMKHEQLASKRQGMILELERQSNNKTELEKLKEENKHLKTEIEKLRAELAMYKAIEQSKQN